MENSSVFLRLLVQLGDSFDPTFNIQLHADCMELLELTGEFVLKNAEENLREKTIRFFSNPDNFGSLLTLETKRRLEEKVKDQGIFFIPSNIKSFVKNKCRLFKQQIELHGENLGRLWSKSFMGKLETFLLFLQENLERNFFMVTDLSRDDDLFR